jgi:hypothetical protein
MHYFFESIIKFNKLCLESDEKIRELERAASTDSSKKPELIRAKQRAGIYSTKTPMQTARGHLARVKQIYRNRVTKPRATGPFHLLGIGSQIMGETPEETITRRRITLAKHKAAAYLGLQRMKEALKQKDLPDEKRVRLNTAIHYYKSARDFAKRGSKVIKHSDDPMDALRHIGRSATDLDNAHESSGLRQKTRRNIPPGAELP